MFTYLKKNKKKSLQLSPAAVVIVAANIVALDAIDGRTSIQSRPNGDSLKKIHKTTEDDNFQ